MKDVITCERGRMRFDGLDVASMADTTPTPFFLFSAAQIERNVKAVRDAFQAHHPATRVFYASKACSNLWFLDRVRRAGIDVEVNSGGELWKARRAGFEPRQIVFNGNAKTRAEIEAALQPPIEAIVVDSVFELRRVADVAADLGTQARVSLRVDLNVATETHPGLRTSTGAKAGIDASEALGAFGLAAQLPAVHLVGMHYHIGSQITHIEPFLEALGRGLALLERVETAHDLRLEHLDIGGGLAIPYYDRSDDGPDTYFEAPHTLEDHGRAIAEAFHAARPDLQLYLEPGRAIAGNTAILVTRVEAEKTKLVEAAPGRILREDWLMVDAGFNTILEHSSYHWYFRAVVANRCSKPPVRPFRLGGPSVRRRRRVHRRPRVRLPLSADREQDRRRDRLSRRRRLLAGVHERLQRPRPGGRIHGHRGRPAEDRRTADGGGLRGRRALRAGGLRRRPAGRLSAVPRLQWCVRWSPPGAPTWREAPRRFPEGSLEADRAPPPCRSRCHRRDAEGPERRCLSGPSAVLSAGRDAPVKRQPP